ncbi:inositol monophosphatase family protein [Candidatus Omnitrophota bacterium]
MEEFLNLAINAAKAAGEVHKKYYNTNFVVNTKETSFDRVTVADTESEKVIVDMIKQCFNDHNILAEENKYEGTPSEYTWVIDPLDGTNNFSFGLPIFCVSIALAKHGKPIVGVIYDVSRDELFYAGKGKGAFLNGEKIFVSGTKTLDMALLITGFYYDRGEKMLETLEHIKAFYAENIVGVRRLGAAALDLCYVACGRATGFWEFKLSPWDFAAGMLLIEEAGGKVTGRRGEEVPLSEYFIVSSNGYIHDQMVKILSK